MYKNGLKFELLWLFPGEFTASEVSVAGSLLVDWLAQLKVPAKAKQKKI